MISHPLPLLAPEAWARLVTVSASSRPYEIVSEDEDEKAENSDVKVIVIAQRVLRDGHLEVQLLLPLSYLKGN